MSILTNFLGKRKRGLLTPEEDEPGGILGQIGSYMPPVDNDTQGAIDEYASMPEAPKKGGMFGGDPGQFFGNLASSLGQAGAYWSGDWDVAESIGQSRAKQMQEQAELAAAARQREQIRAALRAQGLTDEQAMLAMNKMANIGDFKPKDDEFDRMMERAGIAKGSPEYMAAARRKAQGDPYLTGATLPNGGQFYGYASDLPSFLNKQPAPQAPAPDRLPPDFDFDGGPTRPASGGFRAPPRFRR